jgi:Sulfite exporter TauE/SafE
VSLEPVPGLVGLFVGFLVGLTGVGGGSLMTPFLIAVMQVPAPTAIGTDMVFATATKMVGSVQHYRQRSVNLEVAIFLGLGSIPASLLGVWTLEWIKGASTRGGARYHGPPSSPQPSSWWDLARLLRLPAGALGRGPQDRVGRRDLDEPQTAPLHLAGASWR